MPRPTVTAHFHGGPFDGGSLSIDEDRADELVVLSAGPDGPVLGDPVAEGEERAGRELYRLSTDASGLEGDVEYAYAELLEEG
ncbi:hypothetical protein [Patulibacter minatonensis]|uniref:hypothetical protein n=1 Tax=Patulibacter minatonensis TaxID=298163 RepID=UPI000478F869|nr:hypothetical protein [Patulibacter minatonensis]